MEFFGQSLLAKKKSKYKLFSTNRKNFASFKKLLAKFLFL